MIMLIVVIMAVMTMVMVMVMIIVSFLLFFIHRVLNSEKTKQLATSNKPE